MSHYNPSTPRTAPPPYDPNPGYNHWPEASETTPLNREADGTDEAGYAAVRVPKKSASAGHPILRFTLIVICVAIAAVIFDCVYVRAPATLERMGMEAERRGWRREREAWKLEQGDHDRNWKKTLAEWNRERTARELEHRRTLEQWVRERNSFLAEWKSENAERERQQKLFREVWDREREERERERRAFDRERAEWDRQREEHKPFWDPPNVDSPQCIAYNTRRYKSRLWNVPLGGDWFEACMYTPIKIHDRQVTHPEKCDIVGRNEIYGYFRIDFDEMDCQPTWGKPWDHGCVGGGIHVLESTLWGLESGQDWYEMCRTTPGNIPGIPGDLGHPVKCENRGVFGGGMVGRWEFYDPKCH